MSYTDVFGNTTLPPAEYGYASFALTGNATFVWPYNSDGAIYTIAKVMDFTCQAGNYLTLPDATQVSTGEDFLVRNTGANALIVKDSAGTQVASVSPGAASYLYLTSNATAAGVFGVIGFGVGTSTVDAASLVGYGIKAVGASLNQSHPVVPTSSGITLADDHRSKLVVFTGGVATFALTSAATLGDDYFTMFRNDGTGTATIDPAASELIDGMTSMQVQPGESLILICTGTKWYSVGYGRSTLYQFTQLTKDVSAGGTITLSAAEAANKLITFIGNPAGAVNVVVPSVVAVYYTLSSISTAQTITLKTTAGSGVGITQGGRIIALCDGTNVVAAQSATANTSVSLTDGSASVPSLFFATQTNTGLFKSGTLDLGITANGVQVGVFGSTGLQTSTIGPNSAQRHTLPAVTSDTVTLNAATQTLTNKTLSVDSNTVSGVAASSFVLSNGSGNIDGAAAQKAIPTGVVVGTTDTQTLTNKTVNLASNTLSGTKAQFDTALSDDNFAYVGQANSFTTNQAITVNSTSDALKITQTGTGNALVVEDAVSTDSTPFVIDQNGKVIVGHTAAIGNETAQQIGTAYASSASKSLNFAATNDGPYLIHGKSRGATVGDYTIVANNDALGNIQFQGADGSALVSAAAIRAFVDGTPGLNDMPGRLVFLTTSDGASSPTERMRIDSAGNVGVGLTSGGERLRVHTTAVAPNIIVSGHTSTQATGDIYILRSSSSAAATQAPNIYFDDSGANSQRVIQCAAGTLQFLGYRGGWLEDFRFDSTGNSLHTNPAGGLGYGTGSGGTVTQATSKSTNVTLNKPTGQITMNNAALAAGASVSFTLNNSLIAASDVVLLTPCGGFSVSGNYSIRVGNTQTGAISVFVKNESAGSLSEAVIINFAIIKGASA